MTSDVSGQSLGDWVLIYRSNITFELNRSKFLVVTFESIQISRHLGSKHYFSHYQLKLLAVAPSDSRCDVLWDEFYLMAVPMRLTTSNIFA